MFLRNIWYLFAWSSEVGVEPFPRTVLGERLVAWRTLDGELKVVVDRCPHRFAPLSMGHVREGALVCGYHGLAFDGSGSCISAPFTDRAPPNPRVRAYPAVEQDGAVWVWMGPAEQADAERIRPLGALSADDERTVRGYTRVAANYELCSDNLMDLSHIEFVHTGTFAGAGVLFAGEHSVREEGDKVLSLWDMPDIESPPWARHYYPPGSRVRHTIEMSWTAPAVMELALGLAPHSNTLDRIDRLQAHVVTPETATTTHYFWAAATAEAMTPEGRTAYHEGLAKAFDHEDKPMIEAAQRNLGDQDFWDAKPVMLGGDAAAVLVRRRLKERIRAEAPE